MMSIYFTVILLVVSPVFSESDRKWTWADNGRSSRDETRQSNDYVSSGPQAKYEIHEFQDGLEPRPDIKPHDFRPPEDYRQDYPYLNRPRPGFGPGPAGLIGNGLGPYGQRPFGPIGRPPGPLGGGFNGGPIGPGFNGGPAGAGFNGGPIGGGFNGGPVGPGFGGNQVLAGPVPSWVREPPFKHFDTCKCTEKFNCQSPGLAYGNCDVGKSYCCYNSHTPLAGGPLPVQPVNSVANGILVGPGGPVDPPVDGPVPVKPIGGGYGRPPVGGPVGGPIGGPNGGPYGGPGGPLGGPLGGPIGGPFGGPGGPIGGPLGGRPIGGGYGTGGYGAGGYGAGVYPGGPGGPVGPVSFGGPGRPLPGPLGPRPVHSPANGILVGPGGPFDNPNSPYQRPSPYGQYGQYGRPGGYYGFGRNNAQQGDNKNSHEEDDPGSEEDENDKKGKGTK